MTEHKNIAIENVIKELEEQLGYEIRITNSRKEAIKESEVKINALEEAIKHIKSKTIHLSIVENMDFGNEPKQSWWKKLWK